MFTEVVSVKSCVKTFFLGGGLIVSDGLMALNCEKWMEKGVFSFAVPCFVVASPPLVLQGRRPWVHHFNLCVPPAEGVTHAWWGCREA